MAAVARGGLLQERELEEQPYPQSDQLVESFDGKRLYPFYKKHLHTPVLTAKQESLAADALVGERKKLYELLFKHAAPESYQAVYALEERVLQGELRFYQTFRQKEQHDSNGYKNGTKKGNRTLRYFSARVHQLREIETALSQRFRSRKREALVQYAQCLDSGFTLILDLSLRPERIEEMVKTVPTYISQPRRGKLTLALEEQYLHYRKTYEFFLRSNLRLVAYLAHNYSNRGLSYLDLLQEGNIGLMDAIHRFDSTRGYRFSTFASWSIRDHIRRALLNHHRTVRIPTHIQEERSKLHQAERTLVGTLGTLPNYEELAAYLHWDVKRVQKMSEIPYHDSVSLQTPITDDGEELGAFIAETSNLPEDADFPHELDRKELQHEITAVLSALPPHEGEIIRRRFGIGQEECTLQRVADDFDLSRERIRQIEDTTLRKLRHPSRSGRLAQYYR